VFESAATPSTSNEAASWACRITVSTHVAQPEQYAEAEPPSACRVRCARFASNSGRRRRQQAHQEEAGSVEEQPPGSDPPDGRGPPRGADGPPVPYRRSWLTWTRLRQASFNMAILVPPYAGCLRFVRRCCDGTRRENVTDGTELEDQRVESFVDRRPPLSPDVSARQRWSVVAPRRDSSCLLPEAERVISPLRSTSIP
jgi:hypothetical protein